MSNRNNRLSRFPGTKDVDSRKRLADTDNILNPSPQKIPNILQRLPKEIGSPWKRYQKSFKLNQGGMGYVVHANKSTFHEGIIKSITTSRSELAKIISKPHKNLVHLQEIFYDEGEIFFVYELLDVSLAQIFGSPLGRLQVFEVAAFSKEILAGVQFIHDTLDISHGKLNSSNVLLSVNGAVKIANIGGSMLESRDNRDSQNDIAAIGNMIVECLEPKAFLQGGSLSEQWPSSVSSFANSTKVNSAKELSKHDFLQLSPGPFCLRPYIRLAREIVAKEVDVVSS